MDITPAEALVLLDPDGADGAEALKVTLSGLLLMGVLRASTTGKRRLLGGAPKTHLRQVRELPVGAPPHLKAVIDAVRQAPNGDVTAMAKRLSAQFARFTSFIPTCVLPALVRRGLLRAQRVQETRRVLLLFRRTVEVTRHLPTEAGQREQARLRAAMARAADIPRFLDSDPARAAVLAASLGALIVLVEGLRPHYGAISQAMAMHRPPASDGGGGGEAGSGGTDDWMPQVLDPAALEGFDSALDSVGDSLDSAIDSAAGDGDSGGSDGGGSDGGGSDGGGGGGE